MSLRIHGKAGVVYLQGAGAVAVPVSLASDWEIQFDFDTVSVPALGDVWDTVLQGISKWSGTLQGPIDLNATTLWDAFSAGAARALYIYPNSATPTIYYYGLVWPKLTTKAGISAAATYSAAFVGTGQPGRN